MTRSTVCQKSADTAVWLSGMLAGTTHSLIRPHGSSGPLDPWSRRGQPAKKETTLHALTQSFLNLSNVLGRMPRSPGKQVAGGLVTNDSWHRSDQLLIAELVQEGH